MNIPDQVLEEDKAQGDTTQQKDAKVTLAEKLGSGDPPLKYLIFLFCNVRRM